MNIKRDRDLLWGALLAGAVLLYRPFGFWADNAWTLSDPEDLFKVWLIELLGAVVLLSILRLMRLPTFPLAVLVATGLFLVFNWSFLDSRGLFLLVCGIGAGTAALAYSSSAATPQRITAFVFVVLTLVPALQVMVAHVQNRVGFPVVAVGPAGIVGATNAVEDIVLVVVDGYPMRRIADDLFGHDTRALTEALISHGFESPDVSWSHNTFTGLAIPSLLDLNQIADPGQGSEWQNQKPNYAISRGSNLTVEALRSAGYTYTHIESGWNGDTCGSPDECLANSFADEAVWKLLEPSLLSSVMVHLWGSQGADNSFTTNAQLSHVLLSLDDGEHDFVYAHLMLPHPPQVVDSQCRLVPTARQDESSDLIRDQLQCVDSMIESWLTHFGEHVAVLITGDHGTATRGQLFKPSIAWDDADIAERLGAFLAYKIPASCERPSARTNVEAMRAVMRCATDIDFGPEAIPSIVGLEDLHLVDGGRIARIDQRLRDSR